MDQLICASLSHTYYWYEVGALKVSVMTIHTHVLTRSATKARVKKLILSRMELTIFALIMVVCEVTTATPLRSMCVLCVVILSILDVRLVDVPAGVTQEEGHTGFLHLPSAVLALIFLARRIQPFLPSSTVKSILCTNELIVLHLLSMFLFVCLFSLCVRVCVCVCVCVCVYLLNCK